MNKVPFSRCVDIATNVAWWALMAMTAGAALSLLWSPVVGYTVCMGAGVAVLIGGAEHRSTASHPSTRKTKHEA